MNAQHIPQIHVNQFQWFLICMANNNKANQTEENEKNNGKISFNMTLKPVKIGQNIDKYTLLQKWINIIFIIKLIISNANCVVYVCTTMYISIFYNQIYSLNSPSFFLCSWFFVCSVYDFYFFFFCIGDFMREFVDWCQL